MNTPDLRSPFVERVISLLPRGHEEAMKQAFYNVAAIFLFILMAGATMAVYFILEPFVKPLLWAILVGSVLHPVKQKSVVVTSNWLSELREANTLLIFGFLSVPLQVINKSAEWMGTTLVNNLKPILILTISFPLVHIIKQYYSFSDFVYLYDHFSGVVQNISFSADILLQPIVAASFLGLVGMIITVIRHQRHDVPVILGWILFFVVIVISLGSWIILVIVPLLVLIIISFAIQWGWLLEESPSTNNQNPNKPYENDDVALNVSTPKFQSSLTRLMKSHIVASALSSLTTPTAPEDKKLKPSSSNRYIIRALWACLAVQLWRHMWLLHFVPLPLVYFIVKAWGSYFNIWSFLDFHRSRMTDYISRCFTEHIDQLFPMPLQRIYKAIVYLDRILIGRIIQQLDAIVSVLIIFLVVVLAILASVFAAVQIYGESVHLLRFGTSLANQTLNNPEARQWLPHGVDQMIDLGSVVDNAYSYGKTGITTLVVNSITEKDPARAAQIERIISEALDRVQRAWLTQGETPPITKLFSASADNNFHSNATKPPLLRRLSQDFLNVTVLMNYGRENIGSIFSILDSIWTVLKGNLSLVFKSTTAILSILMGGGTAILNFFVNGVVFLTALYYLLVASDSQYKPIEMVSFLSPGGGNTLGTAMEEAINTVCMASLKLAAFYGLWTWLIHTIFGVNFVVIPVALAALLGAVPFLGTYWAALPAALDLWLAQSRGVEALLLIFFQFAPTLLIDASFYAEIKGGGHPYLTGLAVAGGIFWLGFEGAIIGPLLLCVLLVAVSMYTALVQTEAQAPSVTESNARWFHRRLLRTDTVG